LTNATLIYLRRLIVKEFSQIGPKAPEHSLAANRFSPPGISMFYGGATPEISAKEIRWSGKSGKVLHTGKFITKQEYTILDFTTLDCPKGKFDPQWVDQYHIAEFFRGFIKDLSAPCEDNCRKSLDYVPTQMLCEYFRYFGATRDGHRHAISGIKYPSSYDEKTPCYVFFWDNQTAPDNLSLVAIQQT